MTNDALINGEVQSLTDEEKTRAEKFHRERLAFALVNDQIIFDENADDDRDHQHWLCETFGMTIEEFENIPRGYIMKGKIQLYTGSRFEQLELGMIKVKHLIRIIDKYKSIYPDIPYRVFNGVKVGKVGTIWPPIKVLTFDESALRYLDDKDVPLVPWRE
ncbi:MAG: hypothetical protein NC548_53230 [Lachnospiraceae bacterium]|nr:hypothetical protein [Lachnospiraceae bacterium]MCM1233253.1 hypothetical protein [Ruminococcus flavefaciens]